MKDGEQNRAREMGADRSSGRKLSGMREFEGARLNYLVGWHGPPIVFLGPTPFDMGFWTPMILPLREKVGDYRQIFVDMRGHGGSELGTNLPVGGFARVPDAPVLSISQLARDVIEVASTQLQSAVFVGCSIGGYVALEIWRTRPEIVKALAFICSKAQADSETDLARRAGIIARARAGETSMLLDGMAQTLLGATAREQRPHLVPEVRNRMVITPEALVAVQAGLATRQDSMPTVATIDVPVLAIAGGEDLSAKPTDVEAFKAAPGGCEFHVIPDAGHLAAYEKPEEVLVIFGEWLGRVTS